MNTETQQLDDETKKIVFDVIKNNLTTMYVVWLSLKIRGFTKWYLLISYLLVAYAINFLQYPLFTLFYPISLVLIFIMLYFIDMYFILQSLVKVQLILMDKYGLIFDLDKMTKIYAHYAEEHKIF